MLKGVLQGELATGGIASRPARVSKIRAWRRLLLLFYLLDGIIISSSNKIMRARARARTI